MVDVTGTLLAPDGAALANAVVQFMPAPGAVRRAAGVQVPAPVQAATDGAGALSVALAPGVYSVRARVLTGAEPPPFLVSVPDAATATMSDLLVHLPAPQSVYDAAASARVAADAAQAAGVALSVAGGLRVFASRAAFEAAEVPATLAGWAVAHAGRVVEYVRDAAGTAIVSANGAQGSPAGMPTPLHWGAAPDAAPAVNTAAFNACAAWGLRMHIPAGRWRIDGPVVFAPTTGDRVPCVVTGDGAGATVIEQTDPAQDVLVFAHADPSVDLAVRPTVRDLTIEAPGATEAQRGAAIRHHASLTAAFQNLILDGPTFGIVAERGVQSYHSKIYWSTRARAEGERAAAAFVFDTDSRAGGIKLRSFGSYISDCEFQAGRGTRDNVVIRSLDGMYVCNCHFGFAERHVLIDPDGTAGRETVLDLRVVNCYFDLGGQGANILQDTIKVRAEGAADSVSIRGLYFVGCLMRSNAGSQAFSFDTAEGALSAAANVQSIAFTGCEFRLHTGPAIDLTPPVDWDAGARLRGVTVTGCQHAVNDQARAVVLHGGAITLSGNVYRGGWLDTDPAPVLVAASCDGMNISGEVFDGDVSGLDAVEVEAGATRIGLHGLVGNSGSVGRSVVEEGRDADGWFVRYADGWQVCGRSYTVAGAAIDTAYGGLFRSGDLVDGTQRVFPRPFATGSVPSITMQARVTNYPSIIMISGPASHFQWPTALRVLTDISLASRDVEVTLRAEGRWK